MNRTRHERPSQSARNARRKDTKPIGFLLQRAHNLLRIRLLKAMDGTGLHLGHIAILAMLAKGARLTQRELCQYTGIEKSSMVIFLDGLEKHGWVTRLQHPTDRRAHTVSITAAGMEKLAVLSPPLVHVEKEYLSVLAPSELEQLETLLTALISDEPSSGKRNRRHGGKEQCDE